jgi:hypothetical protein
VVDDSAGGADGGGECGGERVGKWETPTGTLRARFVAVVSRAHLVEDRNETVEASGVGMLAGVSVRDSQEDD